MAITQTGAAFKSLTFDGKTSRSYGVYITGEAVYNAPERSVEMIAIPGRNGAFALDKGRFENIEVTYPAGIFASTETDFAAAISDFRNYLCSRSGYCRLTDEYNPNEYRMAVYKSGLDVSPAQLRAGEFNITFECKPQRFLTSGETATAVASGGAVTNPTLFESSPLIECEGYGEINIGNETLKILNDPIGNINLVASQFVNGNGATTVTMTIDYSNYSGTINSGDSITGLVSSGAGVSNFPPNYVKITEKNGVTGSWGAVSAGIGWTAFSLSAFPLSDQTQTLTETNSITLENGVSFSTTETVTILNHTTGVIDITSQITTSSDVSAYVKHQIYNLAVDSVSANSSALATQTTIYIDLDIGEAYKIENDEYILLNSSVTIPAELPTLSPGLNTITYDNTVTSFKITPRWWKV